MRGCVHENVDSVKTLRSRESLTEVDREREWVDSMRSITFNLCPSSICADFMSYYYASSLACLGALILRIVRADMRMRACACTRVRRTFPSLPSCALPVSVPLPLFFSPVCVRARMRTWVCVCVGARARVYWVGAGVCE